MEWIRIANPNEYNIEAAFNELNELYWKQSGFNIKVNDIVYIYVGAPMSKIAYKTICTQIGLSSSDAEWKKDFKFWNEAKQPTNSYPCIKIKLISKINGDELSLSNLRLKGFLKANETFQGARKDDQSPELFEYIREAFDSDFLNSKVLLCRIGWMKNYYGIDNDSIVNGGSYNANNAGHEIYNFDSNDGIYYGFVEPGHTQGKRNSIHIERLGSSSDDEYIDGVLVVWVATNTTGGQRVVGWYKNARVLRTTITVPEGIKNRRNYSKQVLYNITSTDAYLLDEEHRNYPIPVGSHGIGQSNICYADEELSNAVKNYIQIVSKSSIHKSSSDKYKRAADLIEKRANENPFKMPFSVREFSNTINSFQQKYSPAELVRFSGINTISRVLGWEDGSMISLLREKESVIGRLGHTSQYQNNYPFVRVQTGYQLGRKVLNEEPRIVDSNTAISIARRIIDGLKACADYIDSKPMETIEDYRAFDEYAAACLDSMAKHAWVHKYLYMLYPDLFTEFQTETYRKTVLICLGIEPDSKSYALDWQCKQIQKHTAYANSVEFSYAVYNVKEIMKALESNAASVIRDLIIPVGAIDNWEIVNPNKLVLYLHDSHYNEGIPLPKLIQDYFNRDKTSLDYPINVILNNEKHQAKFIDKDSSWIMFFDDYVLSKIKDYIKDSCNAVKIIFNRIRSNVYGLSFEEIENTTLLLEEPSASEDKQLVESNVESIELDIDYKEESRFDNELVEELNSTLYQEEEFEFKHIRKNKVEICETNAGRKSYPRDRKVAINALNRAGHTCEFNGSHTSFIRKNSDFDYMEPHHLIPMAYSSQFEYSLDVEENVVSLCSKCHNQIHYGRDYEVILKRLYDQRINHLKQVGLELSYDDLLKMYKYANS